MRYSLLLIESSGRKAHGTGLRLIEGPAFDSNSSYSRTEMAVKAVARGMCLFVRPEDNNQRYFQKQTLP